VDLSSSLDEQGLIPDTSWDEEFARRLFGDHNRDILRPPGDGKSLLSDSDEEEKEVHEKTTIDADVAPSSDVLSAAPTASTANVNEDPKGMQDDNSDGLASDQEIDDNSSGGDEASPP
jgi:hypothetical protein